MPKFAMVVTIEVEPERSDQFLPLLMTHRARCLNDDLEQLSSKSLLPQEDDTKVISYEVYRDDEAFDAHRNGPSLEADRWVRRG